jgi:ABC-type sugar transport system ATPase subunit
MQPAIEIRGVEKAFGGVRALAGVDLSVGPGRRSPCSARTVQESRR